ncbi:hypothetical protein ASD80_10100 [Devosia sp. Root635]|nr:hypothetical protein ASD80_10100 [Devosia sp. Root635]
MRLNRETRRTAAQFLNGVAVSVVATLVLAPLAGGQARPVVTAIAIAGAMMLHAAAVVIGGRPGADNH